MIEFISTSYFADRHGQDYGRLYSYPNFDVFNIGTSLGRLCLCMGSAYIVTKLMTALWPLLVTDEHDLYRREKSIARRLKDLDKIEQVLGISEQFSVHIHANLKEIDRLTEKVTRLRLAIDILERKKAAKVKRDFTKAEQDLFNHKKPRTAPKSSHSKFWGKNTRSVPPEF